MFESAKWIAAPQTDQPSPLFRLAFPAHWSPVFWESCAQ